MPQPHFEIGEDVSFRAVVYVEDRVRKEFRAMWGGHFMCWAGSQGDALAVVLTRAGEAMVRWSMIEGIDSPEGLLEPESFQV